MSFFWGHWGKDCLNQGEDSVLVVPISHHHNRHLSYHVSLPTILALQGAMVSGVVKKRERLALLTAVLQAGHAFFYATLPAAISDDSGNGNGYRGADPYHFSGAEAGAQAQTRAQTRRGREVSERRLTMTGTARSTSRSLRWAVFLHSFSSWLSAWVP